MAADRLHRTSAAVLAFSGIGPDRRRLVAGRFRDMGKHSSVSIGYGVDTRRGMRGFHNSGAG